MIIYGTGEKKLSSPQQFVRSRCPQCGEFEVTFHFFRKYAHLFWIPMFPIGSRQVAFCEKCNASYQEGIPSSLRSDLEHAKSRTSFPLSLFSGSAIAVVLMAFIIYTDDGMTTYHYPDKSKQAEGRLVDNKQEGRWVYWHPNGKLQSEQYYRNGTEDSVWAWYNEEGVKIKQGGYKDGMFHGKWSFFYPSGKLQEEDNFFENRKSGPSIVYFEDGSKASEGSYVRDREDGSWTYWYMNGNKQAEGAYVGGEKKGVWKYYYENGKLSNETDTQDSGEYIMTVYDEEGQLMVKDGNGTSIIRYPTGEKANEGSIRNGRYEGRWRSWFPNGKPKEEGFYREGVYSLTNSWDAEGQPMVTGGNGYYKLTDENGVVLSEGPFAEGKANGLYISRTADNIVVSEINYVAGAMEGEIKQYHTNGELAMVGAMKANEKVGVFTWYHMNGQKESEVTFVDGKKEGEQLFWSESGEVVKHEVYKNDELIVEGKGN